MLFKEGGVTWSLSGGWWIWSYSNMDSNEGTTLYLLDDLRKWLSIYLFFIIQGLGARGFHDKQSIKYMNAFKPTKHTQQIQTGLTTLRYDEWSLAMMCNPVLNTVAETRDITLDFYPGQWFIEISGCTEMWPRWSLSIILGPRWEDGSGGKVFDV